MIRLLLIIVSCFLFVLSCNWENEDTNGLGFIANSSSSVTTSSSSISQSELINWLVGSWSSRIKMSNDTYSRTELLISRGNINITHEKCEDSLCVTPTIIDEKSYGNWEINNEMYQLKLWNSNKDLVEYEYNPKNISTNTSTDELWIFMGQELFYFHRSL